MSNEQRFDFTATGELRSFLRALRMGLTKREGFSPTDTVAMAVLCLKERDEHITVMNILEHIEEYIWPTMVHDRPMTYGDASFARMRDTYKALVKPVVQALNTDDPASALLRLHEQTDGKFATREGVWEE
jgi:hypothetical protein